MASNKTTNLGLNQWAAEDAVLREDFNADNAKIDAALANIGNCRIVTGSYVGTGKYNSPNPNTLTFDGKPLLLFVGGHDCFHFWAMQGDDAAGPTRGTNGPEWLTLSWNNRTVSWFNTKNAEVQLNTSGRTYTYYALLASE